MPLIEDPQLPTAEDVVKSHRKMLSAWYTEMVASFERKFNTIWNNPDYSAVEIIGAYGTDAAQLLAVSNKAKELLLLINPAYVPPVIPSKYSVAVNQNGTVTVTEA